MSSISAGTSVGTALVSTGDTTGNLVLKTGSSATTAVTISGANQAVTLAQPLGVASGGTGAASLTANNVLLGNGTSAVQTVAPGTNGNVLTSNGTSWVSQALPAGGVTSLNGQTGAITNTDAQAIGSYVWGWFATANLSQHVTWTFGSTYAGSTIRVFSVTAGSPFEVSAGTLTGTWRALGVGGGSVNAYDGTNYFYDPCLFVRVS